MAIDTLDSQMSAIKRELRIVMVEDIIIPARCIMALRAIMRIVILSVIFRPVVIGFMAGITVAWRILVPIGMACDTV